MIRRTPNRATSSNTSLSSRPEPNNASISPRIFSVGDTRDGTGVVLPVQTLAVLYGTYARRHLHRWMDTAASHPPLCQAITSHARQRRGPGPGPNRRHLLYTMCRTPINRPLTNLDPLAHRSAP